jgi:hypothetical protein
MPIMSGGRNGSVGNGALSVVWPLAPASLLCLREVIALLRWEEERRPMAQHAG